MKYKTGEVVQIGDSVLIENGATPGIVSKIIETQDQMDEWGVEDMGLFIESGPFGLVFWSESDEDSVKFVSRRNP